MPLACVRTRKYDAARSKELMTNFHGVLEELDPLLASTQKEHLSVGTVRLLPCRDKLGRGVMNLRLRLHEPKKYPAEIMARSVILTVLNALTGVPFLAMTRPKKASDAVHEEGEKTQLNGLCTSRRPLCAPTRAPLFSADLF